MRLGILFLLTVLGNNKPKPYRFTVSDDSKGTYWLTNRDCHENWSFGVCVVDKGVSKEKYDLKNPSYGSWQFFPNDEAWANDALRTLSQSGFNTIGAWSEDKLLLQQSEKGDFKEHLPMMVTPILHCGSSAGFPWTDMWDPENIKTAAGVVHDYISKNPPNDHVIGYFSDNELGWWRPALFELIWKQKTHFTRDRVIDLLKVRYRNNWANLMRDFEADHASGWQALQQNGRLTLRPGGNGQRSLSAIQQMLANRYYEVCRYLIKRADPLGLYLGDRYISNYYPEVAVAAGKFCDVVSTNLNANWPDGKYVRYFLPGLEAVTHRPLMITEFYLCSEQNRSGNKNDRSGFPVARTLKDRATGATQTLTSLARTPYVIGAHWFQYYDEPQNGREDGENYNFGLVDVGNKPYQELISAFRSIDIWRLHQEGQLRYQAATTLPRSPRDPNDMTQWDRNRAWIRSKSPIPRGDLYASWSPNGLALRAFWSEERFSEAYFRNGKIPQSEHTRWIIDIPKTGFHWERTVSQDQPKTIQDAFQSQTHYDAASWIRATLPPNAFGVARLRKGMTLRMHVTLISQTRSYKTEWNVDRHL